MLLLGYIRYVCQAFNITSSFCFNCLDGFACLYGHLQFIMTMLYKARYCGYKMAMKWTLVW